MVNATESAYRNEHPSRAIRSNNGKDKMFRKTKILNINANDASIRGTAKKKFSPIAKNRTTDSTRRTREHPRRVSMLKRFDFFLLLRYIAKYIIINANRDTLTTTGLHIT